MKSKNRTQKQIIENLNVKNEIGLPKMCWQQTNLICNTDTCWRSCFGNKKYVEYNDKLIDNIVNGVCSSKKQNINKRSGFDVRIKFTNIWRRLVHL